VTASPCRSELAREKRRDTTGIQTARVIVGDHREQARSYNLAFILSGPECNLALGIQQTIALAVAGDGSY